MKDMNNLFNRMRSYTKPSNINFVTAVQPHIEGRLVRNPAHSSTGPVIIDYLGLISK